MRAPTDMYVPVLTSGWILLAQLLLLVAGTTEKARKKFMPALAGREEDDDERNKTGKHQLFKFFLNLLAFGRQYGLYVKKHAFCCSY